MKNKIFLLIVILFATVFFLSQQSPSNNINGFFADEGSFEILNNYQGKNNVIKIDSTRTQNSILKYSLAQYRGRTIIIEFSADVRREGSGGLLNWQINNEPGYPSISQNNYAAPGIWHNMNGKIVITPSHNNPILYLTNFGISSPTIFYISNPVVNITVGNPMTPDFSAIPLKTIYENYFMIGNIINFDVLHMPDNYFDLMKHHYNILMSMVTYPFQLAPERKGGEYRFTSADNVINLVRRNNFQVHGHVLVHYGDNPAWMTEGSIEEVLQNLNEYITTVVRYFRGRINSWDVVNEAIKPNITNAEARGDWRNCIINSRNANWVQNHWFEKLGADYIELAFRAARAADPNIMLYYNDNDLEQPNKAEIVRKMIQDINDRYKRDTGGNRNLIEGVGSQTHIGSTVSSPNMNLNMNNVRTSLGKLTSLGIDVAITEFDISTRGYIRGEGQDTVMTTSDELAQAVLYARLMSLFKEFSSNIKFITFCYVDDNRHWLSSTNATLFNWRLNPKQAFHAVSDPEGFLRQHGGRTRR